MRETFKARKPNLWSFPHWKQYRAPKPNVDQILCQNSTRYSTAVLIGTALSTATGCSRRQPRCFPTQIWRPTSAQVRREPHLPLMSNNCILFSSQCSLLSWQLRRWGRNWHISTENQPVVLREPTAGLGFSNCRSNFWKSILTGRIFSIPWCNILCNYGLPSYQTCSTLSELENTLTQPLVSLLQLTFPGRLF